MALEPSANGSQAIVRRGLAQCFAQMQMQRGKALRDCAIPIPGDAAPVEGKEMAVRMILTRNASRAELARDLGVSQSTLSNWVRDAIDQSPYGDVLASLHDEVGTLRKEKAALEKVLRARLG